MTEARQETQQTSHEHHWKRTGVKGYKEIPIKIFGIKFKKWTASLCCGKMMLWAEVEFSESCYNCSQTRTVTYTGKYCPEPSCHAFFSKSENT